MTLLHPERAKRVEGLLVLTMLLLLPALAHAGGSALGEQSASAAGQGGTGAARAGDVSAAWYNPAALADGDGWRSGAGMLAIAPTIEARATDGSWRARTQPAFKTPPHAYLSWARRDLAAGLSVNVPFGSGMSWPSAWEGRYEVVDSSLQVIRAQPFAAYRFGTVRIAAGPHVDVATLRVHRKLDMVDTDGDVDLHFAGYGVGAHAAIFVDVSPSFSAGFVAKSRTTLAMRGNADFRTPDEFDVKAHDQRARTELTVPDLFSAGVSWRPGSRWTLAADAGVATWEVWDEIVVDFEDPQTTDAVSRPQWKTTAWLRAGAERSVGAKAKARAGIVIDPSPAPARTLAPNAPDADRFGVTAGLGLAVRDGMSVDAFYEYLTLARRTTASDDSLAASYGGHAHFAGIGVRWQR